MNQKQLNIEAQSALKRQALVIVFLLLWNILITSYLIIEAYS
jgi:hypothetical protein